MQTSLRTHLVAGIAALGVTAIVVTPIVQPDVSAGAQHMRSSITAVALAGWNSPLTEALDSAILATNYLLSPMSPNITPTTNYWDYSGIGPIVQDALDNEIPFDPVTNALNTFQTLGVLPQIVADGFPIITQLVTNASGYLTDIVTNGFCDGTILSQVANHVINLINAIPGLAHIAAVHIVGTLNLLGQEVGRIASGAVAAVQAGDAEGAWNTAVSGLLGPSGLPGLIVNETIGAGVQTGPVSSPNDIAANFVPSIRSFLQTSVQTIATAIGRPTGVARQSTAAPRAAASTAPASARGAVRVRALAERHRIRARD